ncbi:MAG: gliding motility-associated C-terminal domain-containing protein [Flavobacteriales bacterium]
MKSILKTFLLVMTILIGIDAQASVPSSWTVNPSGYGFNMTLTAQVNLNCELTLVQTNTLAAFVGDECRGVAQTGISGFPLTQMTIYSNSINGEDITFKYYDAQNDVVYNLSHELPFTGDNIIGSPSNPEIVIGTFPATGIATSNSAVYDTNTLGDFIGIIDVIDPDTTDVYTLELLEQGDYADFTLTGNQIFLNHNPNVFLNSTYMLHFKGTFNETCVIYDSVEFNFTVAPTDTTDNGNGSGGDGSGGNGDGSGGDGSGGDNGNGNGGGTPTYTISFTGDSIFDYTTTGDTIGQFNIVGLEMLDLNYQMLDTLNADTNTFIISNGYLICNRAMDVLNETNIDLYIRADGGTSFFVDGQFTLVYTNTNVAPTQMHLTNDTVFDYSIEGELIGSLSVDDENPNETYTYSFDVTGNHQNDYFILVDNELFLNHDIDILTETDYQVHIKAFDGVAYSIDTVFTIVINNTNHAPTALNISNYTVFDYTVNGSFVGKLSVDDEDLDESYSYRFLADVASNNNYFTLSNDSLFLNHNIDILTETGYNVHVEGYDNKAYRIDTVINIVLNNTNAAPTAINISNHVVFDYTLNGSFVGKLSVEDDNADEEYEYSFIANAAVNNDYFTISHDSLFLNHNIDILNETGYSVHIEGYDNKAYRIDTVIEIELNNTNFAPTAFNLSKDTVFDYTTNGSLLGVLSVEDGNADEVYTYSFVQDAIVNNDLFNLSNDSIFLNHNINILIDTGFSLHLEAFDGKAYRIDTVFSIILNNTNAQPTAIKISNHIVFDYTTNGSLVGVLNVDDINDDATYTYEFIAPGNTNNNLFTLSNDSIYLNHNINILTDSIYTCHVEAFDGVAYSIDTILTIVLDNTNERPTAITLDNNIVYDYSDIGDLIGTLEVEDINADASYTYSNLNGGVLDNSKFTLTNGKIYLNHDVDVINESVYQLQISAYDGVAYNITDTLNIVINNTNIFPYSLNVSSLVVYDYSVIGDTVGFLTVDDANLNESYTFSTSASSINAGNTFFVLDHYIILNKNIDPLVDTSFQVEIEAYDGSVWTIDSTYTIVMENTNALPSAIHLSANEITDTTEFGFMVGALSVTDANLNETYTYSINSSVADGGLFQIIGNQLQLIGNINPTAGTYQVEVSAFDGVQWTIDSLMTIDVINTNIVPTALHLSPAQITDTNGIGFMIGGFSVDDANSNENYTYQINTGVADGGLFQIVGDSLMFTGVVNPTIGSYNVEVSAYDGRQWTIDSLLTIEVINTNIAPTALHLSPAQITDTNGIGFMIGGFSVDDANSSENYTYQVNSGVADGGLFQIVGDSLMFTGVVNPTIGYYNVEISAYDGRQWTIDSLMTIEVINTNIEPMALHLSPAQITDTNGIGFMIGGFSVDDANANEVYTYQINTGVADGGSFQMIGDSLMFTGVVNPTIGSYDVEVSAYDGKQWTIDSLMTIEVINTNIEPTALHLSPAQITDTVGVGFMIGGFSVDDANSSEKYSYQINSSVADGGLFQIVGDSIMFTGVVNPTIGSYSVEISAYDGRQWTIDSLMTIDVINSNEKPTGLNLSALVVTDSSSIGFVVGELSVTDANSNETFVYSIKPSVANADMFQVVGTELQLAQTVDPFATSYQVEVSAYDGRQWTIDSLFTIQVNNTNSAPTNMILSNHSVMENLEEQSFIGYLSVEDFGVNETYTYVLTSTQGENDNSLFFINEDNLETASVFNYEEKSSYQIEITVSDVLNQNFTKVFTIDIQDEIELNVLENNNYLTPNNDGVNDFWVVENVELYSDYSLEIYNNTGQIIFETSSNYDNTWDGTNTDGDKVSSGVYFYVFKNKDQVYKGNIHVLN